MSTTLTYKVGTMIEIPRAGLVAHEVNLNKFAGWMLKIMMVGKTQRGSNLVTWIGKNGSKAEVLPSSFEKDSKQSKSKSLAGIPRQTRSGPLMPGAVLSISGSERTRNTERVDPENQVLPDKSHQIRRAPSFSGPLMLPNRDSANSLSAPIKASGGFRDSLDEKSKTNLVQIKGRFSVTSDSNRREMPMQIRRRLRQHHVWCYHA